MPWSKAIRQVASFGTVLSHEEVVPRNWAEKYPHGFSVKITSFLSILPLKPNVQVWFDSQLQARGVNIQSAFEIKETSDQME